MRAKRFRRREPDDLAVLIPTSGTTGRSKLVMQTHRAYAMAGEGFPYWMELTDADRLMTSLPLFHINAPAYSVMGSLACGAGLVLVPRFSARGFLDSARRHGATEFNAIGAMLEILMRQPAGRRRGDRAAAVLHGTVTTREWQEAFEQRFGLRVVCGYAMSESPYGLIWRHGTRPYATLGSPRQHPTKGTVNEAQGGGRRRSRARRQGRPASCCCGTRSSRRATGRCRRRPRPRLADGWLHTGDLVTVNADGTYTFVARKKEVLRRRGQNLSPAEVEDAIQPTPTCSRSPWSACPRSCPRKR